MDYKKAGVDIEAGYKSVELMKEHVAKTMRPEVLTNLGGFSGAFSMEKFKGMEKPTLVSGTDGVGTKLKIAFTMDKHDTVGIDCVAMCVNDIACAGGEPLFFLDYIACGKNEPEKIAQIVKGVADGCIQSECALIGGETAEMPGFYPVEEYDLAGFAVGVVDEKDLITGKDIKAGDTLIGIASSVVHSNGFSLVRSVFTITAPSDPVEMRELIRQERRVELNCESGLRFNDLRRWKLAEKVLDGDFYGMNAYIKVSDADYRNKYYTRTVYQTRKFISYWWPIPQDDIDKNWNLVQTPDWTVGNQ